MPVSRLAVSHAAETNILLFGGPVSRLIGVCGSLRVRDGLGGVLMGQTGCSDHKAVFEVWALRPLQRSFPKGH